MKTLQIQVAHGGGCHYFIFHHSEVRGTSKNCYSFVHQSMGSQGGRWRQHQVDRSKTEFMDVGVMLGRLHVKERREIVASKPLSTNFSSRGLTSSGFPVEEPDIDMLSGDDSGVDSDEELNVYRGLVLDVSYRPVNVVCWKRALCLEILEKADVLEYYDQIVMSTTKAFFIPAVLRVCSFVHAPKQQKVKLTLSRNNIFLRDKYRCQYCNVRDELTIDHVQAASRGGPWTWDNLVTACSSCNLKKGDKSVEEAHMKLLRQPREPRELNSVDLPPNYKTFRSLSPHARTPVQWLDYLPRRPPQL